MPTQNARTRGRSSFFILKTAPNQAKLTRFAVVIGARVDRRSSRRHTLKRRAAEVLKRGNFGVEDVILIVLPPANDLSSREFSLELNKLLK